jgi:hypothetical protein
MAVGWLAYGCSPNKTRHANGRRLQTATKRVQTAPMRVRHRHRYKIIGMTLLLGLAMPAAIKLKRTVHAKNAPSANINHAEGWTPHPVKTVRRALWLM